MDGYSPGPLGPLEPDERLLAMQRQMVLREMTSQQAMKARFAMELLTTCAAQLSEGVLDSARNTIKKYLDSE